MMRSPLVPACLLAAAAAAGCGGTTQSAERAVLDTGETPEAVVRAWGEAMTKGDIAAATALFAVPAIVANNTPQIRLETRLQVKFFNETLPCGGRVIATERRGRLVVGTFRLTDRPGGDCGSGTGHTAKAAFDVRRGKIVRWLRVTERPQPTGPAV